MKVFFEGKAVGELHHNSNFVRHVRSAHILQKPPALAIHEALLVQLEAAGVRFVVNELEDGRVLTAPLATYLTGFVVDRGYGRQRGVLLSAHTAVELVVAES